LLVSYYTRLEHRNPPSSNSVSYPFQPPPWH